MAELIGILHIELPNGDRNTVSLFDGLTVRIGRDTGNDIVAKDPGVSRVHSSFTASLSGVVISDLSSTNGTYVNGKRLAGMQDLTVNDVVDVGSTKIRLQLTSTKTVDALSASTSARAMTAQLKPVSVTVIVCTVRGYPKMIEDLPTDTLVESLTTWTQRVKDIIEQCHGSVDKVINNSIVGVWLGIEEKEQADNAAVATQKIQVIAEGYSNGSNWPYRDSHPWIVSTVLSSGLGLTGALGSFGQEGKKGFTIVGDPINEAFRLEACIDSLNSLVVVADSTARLIKDNFALKSLGEVKPELDEEPVPVFGM